MATFPNINPTYSSRKTSRTRILSAEFGDGYRLRAADGINSQRDEWSLVWVVDSTSRDTIINFLEARGGYDDFDWTPIGESTSKKWTCEDWDTNPLPNDYYQIIATFMEEFDLA